MKLLFITPFYKPAYIYGGPSRSISALVEGLAAIGNDVTIFTTNANGNKNFSIETNKCHRIANVDVYYFNRFPRSNFFLSLSMCGKIIFTIKKFDMVYIFGNWSFPFFFASLYSLITRRKYIVSPRTSFMRETWKGKFFKKLIYHILFERLLIQKSTAIHYTTLFEQNESEWLKLSTNKVIIPNPVNLNEFENLPRKGIFRKEYKIPYEYKLFVYLGRIEKRKGIDLAVKAFSIINSKNSDAYFVIAGPEEDDYLKDLQELIYSLGLQNRVIFTGYLNEYDRIKLLRDADIFVLTSFSENFGMSVVEAMACGLPVIISNKVGISNIINENKAGLVTELNINNISDAMSTLLNSKDLRTKMANNAIVTAKEKFSMSAIAKFMDNSLKKILEYSD